MVRVLGLLKAVPTIVSAHRQRRLQMQTLSSPLLHDPQRAQDAHVLRRRNGANASGLEERDGGDSVDASGFAVDPLAPVRPSASPSKLRRNVLRACTSTRGGGGGGAGAGTAADYEHTAKKAAARSLSIARLAKWYMDLLDRHELATKLVSAAILALAGDVIAQ